VIRFLVEEHFPGAASVDGVRAGDTDGSQDALDAMAAAVGRGDEAAGVAGTDEAGRALGLIRQIVTAGGTDKMPRCALYLP
jgi:hypothetical protein